WSSDVCSSDLLSVLAATVAKGILDQQQRVFRRLYTQTDETLALHAKILRLDGVFDDLAVLQFSHLGFGGQADFIQPVFRMHHHHMLTAQPSQHFGHRPTELTIENADDLAFDVGRIGHGAEHIEDSAQAQLAARANGKAHGTVMGRCKHKTYADFLHTASHLLRRNIEFDTR